MKRIDFEAMPIDELSAKRRKLKTTITIVSTIIGAAFIFLVFVAIKTNNYAFVAVVLGASLTLLPAANQLKDINNQIKKRDQSQLVN